VTLTVPALGFIVLNDSDAGSDRHVWTAFQRRYQVCRSDV
jgi:hypothetical protein